MEYFTDLLDLLAIEQTEDRAQYQSLTEKSSATERRANGLAWYPIAIRGSELTKGDYLTLEVERTTHHDLPHQLRFGMPAALFSNHDPQNDRLNGTISHLFGNRLKISFKVDELPDWSQDGKLGIDLLFDENSYDEMRTALLQADKLGAGSDGNLVRLLTGEGQPTFKEFYPPIPSQDLNESQRKAVHQILSANELAIVHGPPGTGKTTTLVQAIKGLIAAENKQVLVCAPSNTAVDLLSERLSAEGINVLRVGNPAKVTERLLALTLDSKMGQHPLMKDSKKLKKQAQEYKNMAHKYKRNFGKAERDQRKLLFDEAHKIMKEVDKTEQYIIDDIISKCQVIAATLVGSNHYTVKHLSYQTAIIDEAGQALEPACWIPILKAQKIVLSGDHFQLPPTIKSAEAAKKGLSTTLLEKCAGKHPSAVVLLEEQYRMHESIMRYPSEAFYNSRLKAHPSVAERLLVEGDEPILFIDTAGCGFDEKQDGTSTTNPEEASLLLKHFSHLIEQLQTSNVEPRPTAAIISPYKQQVQLLKEMADRSDTIKSFGSLLAINTVDSFQGQERDIVYISMTRSNPNGEIGFLADIRRMNVAMTRAKKKLVIFGDSATLGNTPFYHGLIDYAEKCGAYKSAWEYTHL